VPLHHNTLEKKEFLKRAYNCGFS